MAIEVEDGTGKATAESYISVADATTYFTARSITTWGALATDALREAALRRATEYMTQMYRNRWQGLRAVPTVQALDWPRTGVVVDFVTVDYDTVPAEVARACAELALKASAAALSPDLKQGKLAVTVGPIRTEWDKNSPQRKRYAAIDDMLRPFLKSGGGCSVGLVRT